VDEIHNELRIKEGAMRHSHFTDGTVAMLVALVPSPADRR